MSKWVTLDKLTAYDIGKEFIVRKNDGSVAKAMYLAFKMGLMTTDRDGTDKTIAVDDVREVWPWPDTLAEWPKEEPSAITLDLVSVVVKSSDRLFDDFNDLTTHSSFCALLALGCVFDRMPEYGIVFLSRSAGCATFADWHLLRCALFRARLLHPQFATSFAHGLAIALEEAGEVARAELEGDAEGVQRELADLGAVLVRMIEEGVTE